MSRTVTLTNLRSQIRQIADDVNGILVGDADLLLMINRSIGIWHGMLTKAVPERYLAIQSITGNGSSGYALPADYYATLGVEYNVSGSEYLDVPRIMFPERNRWSSVASSMAAGWYTNATQLVLVPPPAAGSYRHHYVTAAPVLAAGGDTIDGVNGWEKWIIYDVAIDVMLKEESDVRQVQAKLDRVQLEMEAAAADRSLLEPRRVVDTRTRRRAQGDPDFWVR